MKHKLLVDGYNLLFQNPELRKILERDLDKARELLVNQLEEYAGKKNIRILIVFDGDNASEIHDESRNRVEVRFSRYPEKADPLIKHFLEKAKRGDDLTVVTSDNEISSYARLCGIPVTSSQKFANEILSCFSREIEKKFDHSMTETELTEWMDLFQDQKNALKK